MAKTDREALQHAMRYGRATKAPKASIAKGVRLAKELAETGRVTATLFPLAEVPPIPTWKKRAYAAEPGSGPAGERCNTCAHYTRNQWDKVYLKCGPMEATWTKGPGTDILAGSPACEKWEAIDGEELRKLSALRSAAKAARALQRRSNAHAAWAIKGAALSTVGKRS